jgi:ABC-2 type transport system permease protein
MPLTLLPFLGSGFVPTSTMPPGPAWFAQHQPFSPVMEATRALLADAPVDAAPILTALGWSLALALGGYLWARRRYDRPTT